MYNPFLRSVVTKPATVAVQPCFGVIGGRTCDALRRDRGTSNTCCLYEDSCSSENSKHIQESTIGMLVKSPSLSLSLQGEWSTLHVITKCDIL